MKICPICSVKIDNDTVVFSHGNPGSKARLRARVCQYATRKGCINDYDGVITDLDKFGEMGSQNQKDVLY